MVYKNGAWRLISQTDPRWNCTGEGVGGFGARPKEVDKKLEELKEQYGEIPDDLALSFMKY
jgi:hypothetical protein